MRMAGSAMKDAWGGIMVVLEDWKRKKNGY